MSYDNLVAALRYHADTTNCDACKLYDAGKCELKSCVLHDAADAIETLQATIELMKPYMPDFFPDANKVTLPKMEVQE